jgi:site-specific DNA-methyltransferase (adenine-specific)
LLKYLRVFFESIEAVLSDRGHASMINPSLYSSRSEEWPTPPGLFAQLDAEFNFTLDPCATLLNAKCKRFFTKDEDGLVQDWGHEIVFCNPPYGKHMRDWARKCYEASLTGATVVLLAHSRTDTRWFHEWVYGKAELRFLKGRLKFGGSDQSAPFPSLVAVFRPKFAVMSQAEHAITGRPANFLS